VTGVSGSYASFAFKIWEIKDKNVKVIPIGIDPNLFHPADAHREEQVILFAGRLEKPKGIEVLEKAIPLILKEMPNVRFYLAGRDFISNDGNKTWSQHLINKFGKERIIYMGALSTEELIRHYQTVTVSIMPSLYEPGGTVAFEAMFCGCPVIASKVGGLQEIIKDRQTGLLPPGGDERALADALIELLQKPSFCQLLSQNALEYVRKNFEITKIVERTLEAYTDTIKNFKRGN
jgi:glycosyltransferase involved in cell wall biosynthesis